MMVRRCRYLCSYSLVETCLFLLSKGVEVMIFIDYCRPTSADAIMFAYLAPILSMPFPKNRLRIHLEGYTNLCNTVHLIYKVYFPPSGEWKFQLFACFQCFCCYFTIKLTMNYIFYRNGNFCNGT